MSVLEITTKIGCPVNCSYCPQAQLINAYRKRGGPMNMSLELFKSCIDKVPAEVTIGFCGMCEPWSNPECTNMLLYAAKKGHQVFIDTTLRGMSLKDFEAISKVKLLFLAVHLPTKDGGERIPLTPEYKKILDAIASGKHNADYIDLNYYGGDLHPDIKVKKCKRNILLTRSGNVDVQERSSPLRRYGKLACKRHLRQNHLLPNGDVILCSADYGLKHILGNLRTQSYKSLFTGDEFRKIERSLDDESQDTLCRFCDSYYKSMSISGWLRNTWCDVSSIQPGALPAHLIATSRRILYKVRHMFGLPPR